MIMAEVNQGKMLSMTGLTLNATLFLVGSPTVGHWRDDCATIAPECSGKRVIMRTCTTGSRCSASFLTLRGRAPDRRRSRHQASKSLNTPYTRRRTQRENRERPAPTD